MKHGSCAQLVVKLVVMFHPIVSLRLYYIQAWTHPHCSRSGPNGGRTHKAYVRSISLMIPY